MKALSLELPSYLKILLLVVAFSFLAYSVYWEAYSVFWIYNVTVNITAVLRTLNIISPLQQNLIIIQEYAASAGYILAFIGAIFAVQCTVMFIKNDKKYRGKLGQALFFEALFFLLLIPSSVHHLLGVALSWINVDVYVGLSFLLQALLIAPPFLMLSYYIRKPQNQALILKWVAISTSAAVWGFWVKYLFLWLDTLSPLDANQASLGSIVGGFNSWFTLIIAGIITSAACSVLYRKRKVYTRLVGAALILLGSYFIVYDFVSILVPVYSSYLYLTDFWMATLPVLGVAMLKIKPISVAQQSV